MRISENYINTVAPMKFANEWFEVNDDQLPVIEFKIFKSSPTEDQINEFLQVLDKLIDTESRFAIFFDIRQVSYISAEARIAIGKWNAKNFNKLKQKVVHAAFLLQGVLGKMMLNGIFLVQKPPYDYILFSNPSEVDAWKSKISSMV